MESSLPSPLWLAAAALLILAIGVVVVFLVLRLARSSARPAPEADHAPTTSPDEMAMPDAGPSHDSLDDEEAPTMVVHVAADAPRLVPARPSAAPTRSAGATIIAFDDDDDDGM